MERLAAGCSVAARFLVRASAAAAAAGASGAWRGGKVTWLRGWTSVDWCRGWAVAKRGQGSASGW